MKKILVLIVILGLFMTVVTVIVAGIDFQEAEDEPQEPDDKHRFSIPGDNNIEEQEGYSNPEILGKHRFFPF